MTAAKCSRNIPTVGTCTAEYAKQILALHKLSLHGTEKAIITGMGKKKFGGNGRQIHNKQQRSFDEKSIPSLHDAHTYAYIYL